MKIDLHIRQQRIVLWQLLYYRRRQNRASDLRTFRALPNFNRRFPDQLSPIRIIDGNIAQEIRRQTQPHCQKLPGSRACNRLSNINRRRSARQFAQNVSRHHIVNCLRIFTNLRRLKIFFPPNRHHNHRATQAKQKPANRPVFYQRPQTK